MAGIPIPFKRQPRRRQAAPSTAPPQAAYAFITAYSTLTVAITYKHRVHTEEAHGGQLGCASCPVLLSSKLPGLSTNQAWAHFGGSNNDRSGSARIPIKRSTFLPCSQQRRSRQQQRQQASHLWFRSVLASRYLRRLPLPQPSLQAAFHPMPALQQPQPAQAHSR